VQGGDPLTKDPAKQALYGTGGLGLLQAEHSTEPFTRGTVAAALKPNQPDSGGAQFFICVSGQPALAGQFTIFGHVSEGMDVVQTISELPADAKGAPNERVTIRSVTIRDTPPPETGAVRERGPGRARATPRGARDDTGDHHYCLRSRQGAGARAQLPATRRGGCAGRHGVPSRRARVRRADRRAHVTSGAAHRETAEAGAQAQPEFNDIHHVKGIVSMARGDDPASATTSFFLVTGLAPSLDGKYTAFGHVVDGMDVVDRIDAAPVNGESPLTRIDLIKVRITNQQ